MSRNTSYQPPFVWFGGKSAVAHTVWDALGDVDNYVEPFFGSGAVLFLRPGGPGKIETVNDADGFVCLAPQTRVLTADLRWTLIGSVSVGDELAGFDEFNGPARGGLHAPTRYRHWRLARVSAVRRVMKPCYRLRFDDGTEVVASADHLWLGGSHKSGGRGWRWQRTDGLVCNRATQRSWVCKLCDVVDQDHSFDAGWVSGFVDGEGHLRDAPGWRIGVTQRCGPEADRLSAILSGRGYSVTATRRDRRSPKHSHCLHFEVNGGMRETLRFLMEFRPERLIRKWKSIVPSMSLYGRDKQAVGLVSKEFLGEREVVAVETDSHTFVAEGLASHNCNFWRAMQRDPEAVADHADWPVNEADLHARHLWLLGQRERITERLMGDPGFFDAKVAGWWVWGLNCWIGSGWCSGRGPWVVGDDGAIVLGGTGQGVNRKRPHLGDTGKGVNRQCPHLGSTGKGDEPETLSARRAWLRAYLGEFGQRLARVRVCCGDWSRVCGPIVTFKHGTTGVFLDPPYADSADRTGNLYAVDCGRVAHDVREWAIEQGKNPEMRIVLAGYEGEHAMPPGWRVVEWKAVGGYALANMDEDGYGRVNSARERLWCSPHCLTGESAAPLFSGVPSG